LWLLEALALLEKGLLLAPSFAFLATLRLERLRLCLRPPENFIIKYIKKKRKKEKKKKL
tara:strand:- start:509 stop:685 length:177 start_codon:yes stop_codon:yes gene_type:complete